jgi:trigger factor
LAEHNVANVVVVGSNPITRSFLLFGPVLAQETQASMSTADLDQTDLPEDAAAEEAEDQSTETGPEPEKEKQKLTLQVTVANPSTCERHVTVVVPREDIDRYVAAEFDELVPKAEVPGFRPGRAPRKLVVNRFKEHVKEQVRSKLVLDAMTQVTEQQSFSAISEPDMKFEAIEMPDDGPLTFEFTIEVRPEFELPTWQGLTIERPEATITDEDVQQHLQKLLARYGKLVDRAAPAEPGDHVTFNITFHHDGKVVSRVEDTTLALKATLSFRDAQLEGFASLIAGAHAGERREKTLTVSQDAESEALRGKEVTAHFEIVKVQRLDLPKLTPQFLNQIGGFTDEEDLRTAVREELERQNDYRQTQYVRRQITEQLTRDAKWDLPPRLLKKQTKREVQRMVLELQSAGFSDEVIQAHANQLQRNSQTYTATALKEHFILERLAEDQQIDAQPEDYDREIELIAEQNGIPPRRVRARLEKRGEMDALRNQIIERKVIDLIMSHALVKEKVLEPSAADDVVALDHAVSGAKETGEIPQATQPDVAKPLPGTPERA